MDNWSITLLLLLTGNTGNVSCSQLPLTTIITDSFLNLMLNLHEYRRDLNLQQCSGRVVNASYHRNYEYLTSSRNFLMVQHCSKYCQNCFSCCVTPWNCFVQCCRSRIKTYCGNIYLFIYLYSLPFETEDLWLPSTVERR